MKKIHKKIFLILLVSFGFQFVFYIHFGLKNTVHFIKNHTANDNWYHVLNIVESDKLTHIVESGKKFFYTSEKFTTVIGIYFPLNKSKHSINEYRKWSETFIKSVNGAPFVIATDKDSKKDLIQMRTQHQQTSPVHFIVYKDVWELFKEFELFRNQSYTSNYKKEQQRLDPEKEYHNPDLYAIWNLKSYFCLKVARMNPFGSHFFIYTDIGAWRGDRFNNWPNRKFTREIHARLRNRMLFGQISMTGKYNPNHKELIYKYEHRQFIEGTFFAGSHQAIEDFYNVFFDLHDKRLSAKMFVGKDQHLMSLYTLIHPERVVRLQTENHLCQCDTVTNPWFFYQIFFSNQYSCHVDRFSILNDTIPL